MQNNSFANYLEYANYIYINSLTLLQNVSGMFTVTEKLQK